MHNNQSNIAEYLNATWEKMWETQFQSLTSPPWVLTLPNEGKPCGAYAADKSTVATTLQSMQKYLHIPKTGILHFI